MISADDFAAAPATLYGVIALAIGFMVVTRGLLTRHGRETRIERAPESDVTSDAIDRAYAEGWIDDLGVRGANLVYSSAMPAWEQGFDIYMANVDGARTSFVVDLNAAAHAPVATHPIRVQVRVKLLRPRPDGLRDESELEGMGSVEDGIEQRLTEALDAIYVGRFLGVGATTFVFYIPQDARAVAENLGDVIGPLGEYRAEWRSEDDPKWGFYFDFLYPDEISLAWILNHALLDQRREMGDRFDVPRDVDHLALFPSRVRADAAAKALRAAGFRVDEVTRRDDVMKFALEFHRTETLEGDRADEFCAEIRDLIKPLGGEYDGWGAMIVAGNA